MRGAERSAGNTAKNIALIVLAGALLGVAFACIARAAVKRMTARSRIEL